MAGRGAVVEIQIVVDAQCATHRCQTLKNKLASNSKIVKLTIIQTNIVLDKPLKTSPTTRCLELHVNAKCNNTKGDPIHILVSIALDPSKDLYLIFNKPKFVFCLESFFYHIYYSIYSYRPNGPHGQCPCPWPRCLDLRLS